MFGWIKELSLIRHEARQRRAYLEEQIKDRNSVCQSCEILKAELERTNIEKRLLLDKLLYVKDDAPPAMAPPISLPQNRHIPWSVKRQSLEAEDRAKAAAIRKAGQPDNVPINVNDLEKELDVVEKEREK